jgi:tetratricopeptide (TPR) repeat protein
VAGVEGWLNLMGASKTSKEKQPGMGTCKRILFLLAAAGLAGAILVARDWFHGSFVRRKFDVLPPATLLPSNRSEAEQSIRYLEQRAKGDADDFIARNKLATYYLQLVRETGDLAYLNLASRAAQSSLITLTPEHNVGGLVVMTQVEFASHDFTRARDHAIRLAELDSDKSYPHQMLGDALLELGDYYQAQAAFLRMEQFVDVPGLTQATIEQRASRMAFLHGDTKTAQRKMQAALVHALRVPNPPRETIAWCRWQLGEIAFSVGDYAGAERHYRDALTTFPDYFRAVASLGRVRAAQGDFADAIKKYERAVYLLPDPSFVAALGDLYQRAGREKDATAQYRLVGAIAHLSDVSGVLYNRQQALFLADHDLDVQQAYAMAAKEYAVRRDIYGADALAWTAVKAGKLVEAQSAMKDALRLGTNDAKLFYHAGIIAHAAGDEIAARDYLQRALTLSPQFDPLQAPIARNTLMSLDGQSHGAD